MLNLKLILKKVRQHQAFTVYPLKCSCLLTLDAEARGEPYIGQVAVGAVIMNRIRDSRFPNTLSGVIYQPWAFTAVARGHIWEETPSDQIVKATLAAYRGWDPTYGCVYYYNAAKVETNWIFSRKTVRTIGKHIFAK